jgi:hypothetical protein
MKAEIKKTKKEKTFEPFEMVLSIETVDEARLLWHLFNCKLNPDAEVAKSHCALPINKKVGMGTWSQVNDYMETEGLLK